MIEKKIAMQEVFEKIIEKFKEIGDIQFSSFSKPLISVDDAIEIVKQEAAEYNNGWIPCSDRLPDEAFGCLVTVIDCEPSTQTDFENILPYFVGYDGNSWNDADGKEIPFEVVAWKQLPAPYQPKGE